MAREFLAAILFISLLPALSAGAQLDRAAEVTSESDGIHIYAAPDDSTPPIGALLAGESTTPVAESQGAGDVKWYLVKTKSGIIGWIKQSDSEHSKRVDSFFRSLPRETGGVLLDIPKTSAAKAPSGSITVPVNLSGRSVIVPVTLNRTLTVNLLLDTGADTTLISRAIAKNLALYSTRSSYLSGIGGTVIAPLAKIDSLRVGEAEVSGITVSIHNFSRDPGYDGLLGMDFLGRFQVSVDPVKRVLVLAPR